MKQTLGYLCIILLIFAGLVKGQEQEADTTATAMLEKLTEVKGQVEGMNETVLEM
ncbi:MAG: hypothetical protein HYV28_04340, partial [Ignavibacteriales bacterium]|nr:hypothetical protein [Ignavibacteriales bacterium]